MTHGGRGELRDEVPLAATLHVPVLIEELCVEGHHIQFQSGINHSDDPLVQSPNQTHHHLGLVQAATLDLGETFPPH